MSLVLASCETVIPQYSLNSALAYIKEAERAEGDTYAPVLMKKARSYLSKSHRSVVGKKSDSAREQSLKAAHYAREALKKSLPLLAADSCRKGSELLATLKKRNGEIFTPTEYHSAEHQYNLCQDLMKKKQYRKTISSARECSRISLKAISLCDTRSIMVSDNGRAVDDILMRAFSYGLDRTRSDVREILSVIHRIPGWLEKKEYRTAYLQVDNARKDALKIHNRILSDVIEKKTVSLNRALKKKKDKKATSYRASKEALDASSKYYKKKKYQKSLLYLSIAEDHLSGRGTYQTVDNGSILYYYEKLPGGKKNIIKVDRKYYYYVVKKGKGFRDTLWGISARFYHKGTSWRRIYRVNKRRIKNPHVIYPGWIIRIPREGANEE